MFQIVGVSQRRKSPHTLVGLKILLHPLLLVHLPPLTRTRIPWALAHPALCQPWEAVKQQFKLSIHTWDIYLLVTIQALINVLKNLPSFQGLPLRHVHLSGCRLHCCNPNSYPPVLCRHCPTSLPPSLSSLLLGSLCCKHQHILG